MYPWYEKSVLGKNCKGLTERKWLNYKGCQPFTKILRANLRFLSDPSNPGDRPYGGIVHLLGSTATLHVINLPAIAATNEHFQLCDANTADWSLYP